MLYDLDSLNRAHLDDHVFAKHAFQVKSRRRQVCPGSHVPRVRSALDTSVPQAEQVIEQEEDYVIECPGLLVIWVEPNISCAAQRGWG